MPSMMQLSSTWGGLFKYSSIEGDQGFPDQFMTFKTIVLLKTFAGFPEGTTFFSADLDIQQGLITLYKAAGEAVTGYIAIG